MTTVKEIYLTALTEAMNAAKGNMFDKANMYANIAQACGLTLGKETEELKETVAEETPKQNAKAKKEALKKENSKAKKEEENNKEKEDNAVDKTVEDAMNEAQEDQTSKESDSEQNTDEWNEENSNIYADHLAIVNHSMEFMTIDQINECINLFDENCTSLENIVPSNIEAFIEVFQPVAEAYYKLREYYAEYPDDVVDLVATFSENVLTSLDDINGANVEAFVTFLDNQASE